MKCANVFRPSMPALMNSARTGPPLLHGTSATRPSPDHHQVVRERAWKQPCDRRWIVRGDERQSSEAAVRDGDVFESGGVRRPFEIRFKQGGAMRRIVRVLKRGEPALRDQR